MDIHEVVSNSSDAMDMLATLRRGLLGAFYKIKKNMHVGKRFFYVSVFVQLLQLLYLPISERSNFHWPEHLQTGAERVLGIFAFGFLPIDDEWTFYALSALVCCSIIALYVGVSILAYDEVNQTSKYSVFTTPLELLLRASQTVLLIPYTAVLSRMIRCNEPFNVCQGDGQVIFQVLGIIFFVALMVVTGLNALLLVHQTSFQSVTGKKLDGIFGAAHGRVELLSTMARGLLAFSLGILPSTATASAQSTVTSIWLLILFVGAISLIAGYLYFLPFLNMQWNKYAIAMYSIFLWLCVCAAVTEIVKNPLDWSSRILFFSTLPFLLFSIISVVELRKAKLVSQSCDLILLNPYLCEVRIRLLHFSQDFPEGFEFGGKVEDALLAAREAFPQSGYLKLYSALVCISSSSKRILYSLKLIRGAIETKLALDQEFLLFCLNKHNEERHGSQSGAVSFMAFDAHMSEARSKIISTLKKTAKFWKSLLHDRFTINDLINQGAVIHHEAEACRSHISKLLKISKSSPEVQQLYAAFVNYVLNDSYTAMKILDRQANNTSAEQSSNGYAVATISGNSSSLGKVLDVTEALAGMFGYNKKDMLNRNVNFLCPSPYDRFHDMFLKQFLSLDVELDAKNLKSLVGQHSDGSIFPIELVVSPSTNSRSDLILIAKFMDMTDPSKHLLLIDANSGVVTACSRDVPRIMSVEQDEVFALNVHVLDLIPDFYDDKAQRSTKYTKAGEHILQLKNHSLCVSARHMKYGSKQNSPVSFQFDTYLITMTVMDYYMSDGEDGVNSLIGDMVPSDDEEARPNDGEQPPILSDTIVEEASKDRTATEQAAKTESIRPAKVSKPPMLPGILPSESHALQRGNRRVRQPTASESSKGSSKYRHGARSHKHSSASSAASSEAGEPDIRRIHRYINAKLQHKDPKLAQFSKFLKVFVVLVTGIVVVQYVVLSIYYNQFETALTMSNTAHLLTHGIVKVASIAEFSRNPLITAFGTSYARTSPNTTKMLIKSLENIKTMHLALTADADSLEEDSLIAQALHEPNLEITRDGEIFQDISYHMSVLEYTSHLENYIYTDQEACDSSCRFIVNNGPFKILERSLEATPNYETRALESIEKVSEISLYSIYVILCLLLTAFFYGFFPMFRNGTKRKAAIGNAVVAIPYGTIVQLHKRANRRISAVQNNKLLNDNDDEVQEDKLLDQIGGDSASHTEDSKKSVRVDVKFKKKAATSRNNGSYFSRLVSFLPCRSRPKKVVDSDLSSTSNPSSGSKRNRVAPEDSDKEMVELQTEGLLSRSLRFVAIVLKVGVTFWVMLTFVTLIAIWDQSHADHLKLLSHEQLVSGLRSIYFDSLFYWVIQDMNNTDTGGFREDGSNRVDLYKIDLDLFNLYDRAWKYGNTTLKVEKFAATTGELYETFFEDACHDVCQTVLTEIDNSTFAYRIANDLTHGLALGIDRFISASEDLLLIEEDYHTNSTPETLELVRAHKGNFSDFTISLMIGEQLSYVSEYYNDRVHNEVADTQTTKTVILVVFVFTLGVSYLLTIFLFKKMDKEIKDSQTLLFMLPIEVFSEVPEMQRLVFDQDASS